MRASRAAERGVAARRPGVGRQLRRARAVLRLHRNTLVAVFLAAGIVLMTLHWR